MRQQTLALAADHHAGFEQHRRPTRRDAFLATMEEIVPWSQLCSVIEPHYPTAGSGRPPIGLVRMVRMYVVQHGFNLADEACGRGRAQLLGSIRHWFVVAIPAQPIATTLGASSHEQ